MYRYRVEQRWTGWWGGFGRSSAFQNFLNKRAAEGWRLVGTKNATRLWLWIVPRPKMICFFEGEASQVGDVPPDVSDNESL